MIVNRPVRALLINENIGGHATVHHHLRRLLADRHDLEARIVDVPPPNLWRKVAGVALPGLARWDADLRAARYQIAQSAWVARHLAEWIAGDGTPADVVHFYTHNTCLLAHSVVRRLPYVVTIDSTNAQSNLMHPEREPTRCSALSTLAVRPFERRVYTRAATVVANSDWCAQSLVADYGVSPSRVQVLPMGVPVPSDVTIRTDRVAGLPRVLFVGRTMLRKGGAQLLDVHQRWLADRCELVLVTQDFVPPSTNVTVLNDIRPGDGRLDAVLRSADIFVLPSRLDQWPNALMEAMSYGVPSVVSDVGGLPEMVSHGQAGVVLTDRLDATLRDAIVDLLDNPVRRHALGRLARRRVEDELDVQVTAHRLLDVIRDAGQPTLAK